MKTLLVVKSFWKTTRLKTDGENAHGKKDFTPYVLILVQIQVLPYQPVEFLFS